MKVEGFVQDEKARLDAFLDYWKDKESKDYPEDMSESEWIDQYFSWLEPV